MKPVSSILFDLDGTLVDSREDITASVNEVREICGLQPLPLDEVARMVGLGIRVLLRRALGDVSSLEIDEAVKLFRSHYREHCLDKTLLYPGVEETLQALSALPQGVVSNKPEEFCRKILQGLGVADRFGVILGGDSTAEKKPHPEPIFKALLALQTPASGAILVGDSPVDVNAGRQAGVRTCGVTYGIVETGLLKEARPDHLIDRITDLPGIISGAAR